MKRVSRENDVIGDLKELFAHRELLWVWTLREIKVRYKQSVLGAAWAILQPVVLMLVFTVVFSFLARVPSDGVPYPIFSYTALLPWTFLATSIAFAVPSLVNNMNLVTKIYFPREVLPISAVAAAFVDFLVASVVFVGLMLSYRLPLQPSLLWLPLLLTIQILLTLGIVLPASALLVWYRDIRFVVPLCLQLWMYTSPIIYPTSLVPERLRALYMLNPLASLTDSYRRIILRGQPPQVLHLAISAVTALVLLLAGYAYFKRSEALFADII
jgi:lipopolysaccharide transport system permease protein